MSTVVSAKVAAFQCQFSQAKEQLKQKFGISYQTKDELILFSLNNAQIFASYALLEKTNLRLALCRDNQYLTKLMNSIKLDQILQQMELQMLNIEIFLNRAKTNINRANRTQLIIYTRRRQRGTYLFSRVKGREHDTQQPSIRFSRLYADTTEQILTEILRLAEIIQVQV